MGFACKRNPVTYPCTPNPLRFHHEWFFFCQPILFSFKSRQPFKPSGRNYPFLRNSEGILPILQNSFFFHWSPRYFANVVTLGFDRWENNVVWEYEIYPLAFLAFWHFLFIGSFSPCCIDDCIGLYDCYGWNIGIAGILVYQCPECTIVWLGLWAWRVGFGCTETLTCYAQQVVLSDMSNYT